MPLTSSRAASALSLLAGVLAVPSAPAAAQPATAAVQPASAAAGSSRASRHHTAPAPRPALTPLSSREAAQQLLNRFTYGARPGEVDRVLQQGPAAWLEQQLHPATVADPVFSRRLAEYPTVSMQPAQALALFPDAPVLRALEDGKMAPPSDPKLAAVYQVQQLKYDRKQARKAVEGSQAKPPQPPATGSPQGDASAAAPGQGLSADLAELDPATLVSADQKRAAREMAAHLAQQLISQPPSARIPALLRLPVEQRAAVATFVAGDDRAALLKDVPPGDRELFYAMSGNPGNSGRLQAELAESTILRDILSERQLEAVMTDFWFNHFNVYMPKEADRWYTPTYVRDTIRPHALGHFRDLLVATASSPAMLVYLDNSLSIGPNSPAADAPNHRALKGKGSKGLNENYGRELMELHTLSVDGGYTQADVTALSTIFTGWTVEQPRLGGPFSFEQRRHEPGDKQWLGHTIHEGRNPDGTPNGMREGLEALDILARSPQTAHFISTLLAQRFVADTPPSALVDQLTRVYLSSDGDISAMLRAIVASPEFNSRQFFRSSVKTPLDFVASAFRSTGTDPANPAVLVSTLREMGMPLYNAQPPTGYYLTATHWMNSAALVDRLSFADALTSNHLAGQPFDPDHLLAVSLLTPASLPLSPEPVPSPARTPAEPRRTPSKTLAIYPHPSSETASVRDEEVAPNGFDVASEVMASTVLGTRPAAATRDLLHQQLTPSTPNPLSLLTRLLLSSPEFQVR